MIGCLVDSAHRSSYVSVMAEQTGNIKVLGPKYEVRLQVTCGRCGHVGMLTPSVLVARFPPYSRLVDLEKNLQCTRCKNRMRNSWAVVRLPRD